jgi:hypothetical protein
MQQSGQEQALATRGGDTSMPTSANVGRCHAMQESPRCRNTPKRPARQQRASAATCPCHRFIPAECCWQLISTPQAQDSLKQALNERISRARWPQSVLFLTRARADQDLAEQRTETC